MLINDFDVVPYAAVPRKTDKFDFLVTKKKYFFVFKRIFDIFAAVLLLPLFGLCALILLVINPLFNAGPLFYVQRRMGLNCAPFDVIKFRSMIPAKVISRGADDPLERDRITKLGQLIRKSRVDELPQLLNVLKGDMSMIGPRPDYYDHALEYLATVPGYSARHTVRPGISGLAQTEIGYIEGVHGTKKKVAADHYYISNCGFSLDTWVVWRTVVVVVCRAGS